MIKDYLDELIGSTGLHTQGSKPEVHWDCPLCDDRRKRLYVNMSSHLVYCQNCDSYNRVRTVPKLIQAITGMDYIKAFSEYRRFGEMSFKIPDSVKEEVLSILSRSSIEDYYDKNPVPLPQHYTLLDESESDLARMTRKYLKYRGVTDGQITFHNMGYCYDGKYKNRAIIPVYEGDLLRFWIARSIDRKATYLKELSPSNNSQQIGKSDVVFNLFSAANLYGSIVITEGIFDALTFGDIGVSLLGSYISDEQIKVLLRYREIISKGVYVALDEDARDKALDMAYRLYQYFPVFICNIHGDPNSMGKEQCREALENAVEFTPLSNIILKLGALR